MSDQIALMLEAERRGILPPEKSALLAEARRRGLVPQAAKADFSNVQSGGQPTVTGAELGTDTGSGQLISGKRKPAAYRAADKVGMGNVLGAYDALQHHVLNIPEAIGQLSAHGVNALVQGVAGGTDYAKGVQSRLDAQDAGLRKREADYQARTDGNAGSYAGAVVGEVLPWMVGLGEARAAGLLPKIAKGQGFLGRAAEIAKKGGLLAAEGGTMGLLQPVTGDGSYGAQKALQVGVGAAAAPAIGAAAKGAGAVVGGVRNTFSPAARLSRMYGLTEADLPALRNANSGVPGVPLTVAQALPDPERVAAERVLRNRGVSGPIMARSDSAANKAMQAEAERIAGTPADVQAAKQARAEATDPYWASLPGKPAPAADVVAKIEATTKTGLGQGKRVRSALAGLRADIEAQADANGNIDADVLNGIRQNFRSYFDHKPTAQELKALEPVADQIATALESSVPGYRASVAAFRDLSKPINDMAAGRELADAITRGGRDASGNQAVHLSKIEGLLGRNAKGKFPMTPATRQRIEALAEAQRMRSVSNNNVAASGPGTAADLGRGLSGKILPTVLSAGAGSFGGPLGFLAGLGAAGGYHLADTMSTRQLAKLASNSLLSADALEALFRRRANPFQLQAPVAASLLPYQQ